MLSDAIAKWAQFVANYTTNKAFNEFVFKLTILLLENSQNNLNRLGNRVVKGVALVALARVSNVFITF